MEIGACGIACGLCSHFVTGSCEGCVAGNSQGAAKKLDAQRSKLGFACPVLECAFDNKVAYCLKDCNKFPCEVLYRGFPYSQGFLDIFKK